MRFINLNFTNLLVTTTGLYLLTRNLFLLRTDPFLLYIGLLLLLFFYFKNRLISLLILGMVMVGAGVGQILIANQLTMGLSQELIISIMIGLALIGIFILNPYLRNSAQPAGNHDYWPLFLGLIVVMASLVYQQGLQEYCWQYIQTYWPLILPCLAFIPSQTLKSKKNKTEIKAKNNLE